MSRIGSTSARSSASSWSIRGSSASPTAASRSGISARPTSWSGTSTAGWRRSCRSKTRRPAVASSRSSPRCSPTTAARGSWAWMQPGGVRRRSTGRRERAIRSPPSRSRRSRPVRACRVHAGHARVQARSIRAPDMATQARPKEVELKYRLRDAASGERFLAADSLGPFRASSAARTAQHEDRYLDTSDGALARAGFAARLRQTNAGTIVSVKATTALDGALARREELEGPADRTAEPRDWPPSAARSLILELCGDAPLVELVTVRQLRRKRRLKAPDAAVELSLDEVDVVARGRVIDRFAELEVELTSGDEARLGELRDFLEKENGLTPATSSKLEAALAASEHAGVSVGDGATAGGRDVARGGGRGGASAGV